MLEMKNLRNQMKKTKLPYVRQIGDILLQLAEGSGKIAELVEQDLAVPEMSLEACGKALKAYAQKNQDKGFWGCAFELDKDNPVFQVIFDFYKIPSAWAFEPVAVDTQSDASDGFRQGDTGHGAERNAATIDLMELL